MADADGTVNLSVGPNDIAIVVIPENAEPGDTRVYLLRIVRASANDSDDAKLVSLTLSRIILSPLFDKDIKMYSVDVLDSIVATTVTATAAEGVEVDGDEVGAATSVVISSDRVDDIGPNLPIMDDTDNPPNVASHSIDLSAGANVITISGDGCRLRNNGDLHGQSNARCFQRRDTVLTEPDDRACGRHGRSDRPEGHGRHDG